VFIKILYLVLVLCMGALVGAVIAAYFRIRRHMNRTSKPSETTAPGLEHETKP